MKLKVIKTDRTNKNFFQWKKKFKSDNLKKDK